MRTKVYTGTSFGEFIQCPSLSSKSFVSYVYLSLLSWNNELVYMNLYESRGKSTDIYHYWISEYLFASLGSIPPNNMLLQVVWLNAYPTLKENPS